MAFEYLSREDNSVETEISSDDLHSGFCDFLSSYLNAVEDYSDNSEQALFKELERISALQEFVSSSEHLSPSQESYLISMGVPADQVQSCESIFTKTIDFIKGRFEFLKKNNPADTPIGKSVTTFDKNMASRVLPSLTNVGKLKFVGDPAEEVKLVPASKAIEIIALGSDIRKSIDKIIATKAPTTFKELEAAVAPFKPIYEKMVAHQLTVKGARARLNDKESIYWPKIDSETTSSGQKTGTIKNLGYHDIGTYKKLVSVIPHKKLMPDIAKYLKYDKQVWQTAVLLNMKKEKEQSRIVAAWGQWIGQWMWVAVLQISVRQTYDLSNRAATLTTSKARFNN